MKYIDEFFRPPATDAASVQIIDEAEACAAILMVCWRANELDSEAENAAFLTTIRSRNIFIGYDPEALIAKTGQYYDQIGSAVGLIDAAIGAVREQTRLPLFYHCLEVVLSDGLVTPKEDKVVQYLKRKFRVSDDTVSKALEVLVVKNLL